MLSRSPLSTPVVPFISQRLLFTFSLDSVYLRICKLGNWAGLGGKLVVPYAHELPSKLKDANINGMMIIEMMMMVGTSLRWICRLARMQLKWAADQDQNWVWVWVVLPSVKSIHKLLPLNCCTSCTASRRDNVISRRLYVCLHILHWCFVFRIFQWHNFRSTENWAKLCGSPLATFHKPTELTCLSTAADTVSRLPFTRWHRKPK